MTLDAAARRTGIRRATAKHYLERIKQKYRTAGRPTYTKLDLATRVREDGLLRFPLGTPKHHAEAASQRPDDHAHQALAGASSALPADRPR
jgi:hypothetical protein